MPWLILAVAGIFEVVWAVAMKQSDGFTKVVPSIVTVVGMIISFALLAAAMRTLPLGTAYMIWTGIGAIGAFVVGICFLGEQLSVLRVCAALLIVSGLLLMKLSSH
jgi:quaternary ammonium compound-resistance protein SugE